MSCGKYLPRRRNAALALVQPRLTAAHRETWHKWLFADCINLAGELCHTRKIKKPEPPVPCLGWGMHPGRCFDDSPKVWGELSVEAPGRSTLLHEQPSAEGNLGFPSASVGAKAIKQRRTCAGRHSPLRSPRGVCSAVLHPAGVSTLQGS